VETGSLIITKFAELNLGIERTKMKKDKTKQQDDEMVPEEEVFFGGFLLYAFLVFLFAILLFIGVYLTRK
jgi:hypothetical protein